MPHLIAAETEIYFLSEYAVTVEFGNVLNEAANNNVQRLYAFLSKHPFTGLTGFTPAYSTLSIFYDPLAVMGCETLPGSSASKKVANHVRSILNNEASDTITEKKEIIIPVCYGGNFGPDLDEVAVTNGLSNDEVILLHSQATYRVYMIGFVPGFAYLGGMDIKLTTPRKAIPRKAIPPGSVGIAGGQTGIYPLETPGGWQLIGRTPLRLFDARREEPFLLKAGDVIKFLSIDAKNFEEITD